MKFRISLCQCCHKAWPLHLKSKKEKHPYIWTRCLRDKYYFKNLTLRYYQGTRFLSTTKHTSHTEENKILEKLVGQEILTNPDKDIVARQLKYVANFNIFSACQVCKERIGDGLGESMRCQNCKVRQRIINCKREGSVSKMVNQNCG